jgi:hypothetical protein
MDRELESLEAALDGSAADGDAVARMLADDYDAKANLRGTSPRPFGIGGATRPPSLRTRYRHLQKMLSKEKAGQLEYAQSKTMLSGSREDRGEQTMESVAEMLDEYNEHAGSSANDCRVWFVRSTQGLSVELWRASLRNLETSFGHGVVELMKIMKWMLTLNFQIALIWLAVVIVPRDFSSGETFGETLGAVGHGLLFAADNATENSLFCVPAALLPLPCSPPLSSQTPSTGATDGRVRSARRRRLSADGRVLARPGTAHGRALLHRDPPRHHPLSRPHPPQPRPAARRPRADGRAEDGWPRGRHREGRRRPAIRCRAAASPRVCLV